MHPKSRPLTPLTRLDWQLSGGSAMGLWQVNRPAAVRTHREFFDIIRGADHCHPESEPARGEL